MNSFYERRILLFAFGIATDSGGSEGICMEFATVFNRLIAEHGVTLTELSKATGIAKSTLFGWQNGTDPSFSKLKVLAEYFECSVEYFVSGEREPDPIEEIIKEEVHSGVYEISIKKLIKKK